MNYVITNSTGIGIFRITDTRLYIPLVTLSTQENTKLLQQLNSLFKRNHLSDKPFMSDTKPEFRLLGQVFRESTGILCYRLKIRKAEEGIQNITFQR